MGLGTEQRFKCQFVGNKHLAYNLAVAGRKVQHSQLAFHAGHVFDDFMGLLFAQGEVIALRIKFANHINEGVHRKGVMLTRNGEMRHALLRALVLAF